MGYGVFNYTKLYNKDGHFPVDEAMHEVNFRRNSQELAEGFHGDRVQKKQPSTGENNTSARTHHLCDRFLKRLTIKKPHLTFPWPLLYSVTKLSLAIICPLFSSFCTPQEAEIIRDRVAAVWLDKKKRLACKASQLHANLVTFSYNHNILLCFPAYIVLLPQPS